MVKRDGERKGPEKTNKLDDDIDALFKLSLAEFTSARNALAARLKQSGRRDESDRVKLLAKPSIAAWVVNQLYWMHRDAFDRLIATGKRFRQGQISDMRESLDARREALSHLSELASALLRDAGHNPTRDTMRRITTTLEAMSAYALLPDGPRAGRLTHDLEPPSFESLASLMSGAGTKGPTLQPPRTTPLRKSDDKPPKPQQEWTKTADIRRLQEARQLKITAAKVSLQDAKRSLADARAKAQSLDAAQKQASADAKEAEKYRREAEERLKKVTAASEAAAKALEEAKRTVEKATKELESLLRESPVGATGSHR